MWTCNYPDWILCIPITGAQPVSPSSPSPIHTLASSYSKLIYRHKSLNKLLTAEKKKSICYEIGNIQSYVMQINIFPSLLTHAYGFQFWSLLSFSYRNPLLQHLRGWMVHSPRSPSIFFFSIQHHFSYPELLQK